MKRDRIYNLIDDERDFQDKKWTLDRNGWVAHPAVKYLVLAEEVGEVSEALLKHDHQNLVAELVQVAAVCVKWLESIDENVGEDYDTGECG